MKLHLSILPAAVFAFCLGMTSPVTAQPAAAISNFDQILADVPRGVMVDLRLGSRKMTEAMFQATEQVNKNVKDKPGLFKITVRNVEKFTTVNPPGIVRYRIFSVAEKVRDSGAVFNAFVVSVVDLGDNDKAAKLQKGDKVTVAGKILSGQVYGTSHPGIEVMVLDAKLN